MTDYRDCVTGNHEFVDLWHQICDEQETAKRVWILNLRKSGVVAAHPDDGWVNREDNYLAPCYPQFDDGIAIGSVIALGWPDKYRLVEVVGEKDGLLGPKRWYFQTN